MFFNRLKNVVLAHYKHLKLKQPTRNWHQTATRLDNSEPQPKQLVVHDGSFEDIPDKNRNTYLEMLKIFVNRDHIYRRGHVEFIYAAMRNMESFGVTKDLEVYKALIDILPKGKFIPANLLQVEFMHYPKQQQCVIDLLEQMEDNGVIPDYEMEDLLKMIFGTRAYPLRRYWRMMYWMPKFKNLTPWPLPNPLPDGIFELAQLAIERITSVDLQTTVTVYNAKDIADAIDDTWIVSGQSPTQKRLVHELDANEPVYVEGAFKVWLRNAPVNYFILRTNPGDGNKAAAANDDEDMDDVSDLRVPFFTFNRSTPVPKLLRPTERVVSVHEQDDGNILAVCATGTSSKDSLLSWVRHLERDGNEKLANVAIVFTLRTGTTDVAVVDDSRNQQHQQIDEK